MARSERFKQIRLETIRNLPKEQHTEQSLKIANEIIAAETNHNPVANTDKYSVRVGHTLVVDAKNSVLLNDTDADGDKLEVIPATVKSANGVDITIDKDGTFTYDAKSAAAGPDSFTYQVSDGRGGITTGTVEINVVANTPPVANTDDYSIRAGDTLVVDAKNSVLLNDTDADGDKLEVIPATIKSANGVDVTIDKDGTFTYDAKSAASGPDSFTYQVSDGHGGVVTGTVKINVVANTPPVANKDVYKVRVGDTLVVNAKNSVLLNDKDADGDKLEVIPATVKSDKGIDVTIDKDGIFTYSSTIVGLHSFPYTVSDGHGGITIGTVEIYVEPASTPPPPACAPIIGDPKAFAFKVSQAVEYRYYAEKAKKVEKGIAADKLAKATGPTAKYYDTVSKKVNEDTLKALLKKGEFTFVDGADPSQNLCGKAELGGYCSYTVKTKDRLSEVKINKYLGNVENAEHIVMKKSICELKKTYSNECIKEYVKDFCSDASLVSGTNAEDADRGICGADYSFIDHIVC